MKPVIRLEKVSKRFRKTQALWNVSLAIPPGVVFALLGENGAGKTTMIRILTGFLQPDGGRVEVLNRDPLRESLRIRRAVGYVSDAPALYEWMTPTEIGWFASGFYDEGFAERYAEAIHRYDVPTATKLKELSKGQRAKVALALAIAPDPELLILDEPTSGLDPIVRRQFLESMVDRAAVGRTVLLSSHQIAEVERVADWVAILHEGQLKLVRPLAELKQDVSIVTGILEDPFAETELPRGEVWSESRSGRQVRWLVGNLAPDWAATRDASAGVRDITVTRPTLEEIFVAVCDPRAHRPGQPPPPRGQGPGDDDAGPDGSDAGPGDSDAGGYGPAGYDACDYDAGGHDNVGDRVGPAGQGPTRHILSGQELSGQGSDRAPADREATTPSGGQTS